MGDLPKTIDGGPGIFWILDSVRPDSFPHSIFRLPVILPPKAGLKQKWSLDKHHDGSGKKELDILLPYIIIGPI